MPTPDLLRFLLGYPAAALEGIATGIPAGWHLQRRAALRP